MKSQPDERRSSQVNQITSKLMSSLKKFQSTPALTLRITDLDKLKFISILGLSQFSILPQLPQKIMLASKVVKIDSKIIIMLGCL